MNDYSFMKVNAPNANTVFVLGILSLPFCCCLGGAVGILLGVIAINLANKAEEEFLSNKELYFDSSYNTLKTGRFLAKVGIVFSLIFLVLTINYYIIKWMFDSLTELFN